MSQDRLDVLQRHPPLLFPLSPKIQLRFFLFSWCADMLLVAIFRTAHKPLTLWQSMSLFIGWDLSGHFTRRCSSNSYRQTFDITSHRITAFASFLDHLISFMSVAFGGCNFVATFLCNFAYGCLLYVDTLTRAREYSLFWPALADLRS